MSSESDKPIIKNASFCTFGDSDVIAQAYGPNSRLEGRVTQTDELGTTQHGKVDTTKSGKYFEGQKAYVFLLDSDQNGFPDQMTGPYSLIYTLPESTKSGEVHSRIGIMNPIGNTFSESNEPIVERHPKKFHFEGTITIPNVIVKQGSLTGQKVTIQFDESNFEFPFVEDGPSDSRIHIVKENWIPARIIPAEKSPKDPLVDGYLFVDE